MHNPQFAQFEDDDLEEFKVWGKSAFLEGILWGFNIYKFSLQIGHRRAWRKENRS